MSPQDASRMDGLETKVEMLLRQVSQLQQLATQAQQGLAQQGMNVPQMKPASLAPFCTGVAASTIAASAGGAFGTGTADLTFADGSTAAGVTVNNWLSYSIAAGEQCNFCLLGATWVLVSPAAAVWMGYTASAITAAPNLHTPGSGSVVMQTLDSAVPSLVDGATVTAWWNGSSGIGDGKAVTGSFDAFGNPIILSGDC